MDVADVLDKAADLLTPEGSWTQVAFARGKSGKPVNTVRAAKCFCVLGALNVAAGGNPEDDVKPQGTSEALARAIGIGSRWGIPQWNDAPERTQAEVVAALREAATLARKDSTHVR